MEKIIIKYEGSDIEDTIELTDDDSKRLNRIAKSWNVSNHDVLTCALNEHSLRRMLNEMKLR